MYNGYLQQKKQKQKQSTLQTRKQLNKWLQNYHLKVQPYLIDKYNHRVNSFITKVQQNPLELQKWQPSDIKKEKQQHMKQKLSQQSRKGGRMFRFRDANDFNSFFSEAQRIQRLKNKQLFSRKYGGQYMAYRSIASQSDYNPNLLNQYRQRDKSKQINPPMRYTKVQNLIKIQKTRAKSMYQHSKSCNNRNQQKKDDDNEHEQVLRKNTSHTNSIIGTDDQFKSINSHKDDQQSSQQSQKNLKKFAVTLQHPFKGKRKKQSGKSYFVGITDIKQNSKDPHVKKTLHNILVKIGKTHPNPRDKTLASHVQVLSTDIN